MFVVLVDKIVPDESFISRVAGYIPGGLVDVFQ
jgi:hypothetical protein